MVDSIILLVVFSIIYIFIIEIFTVLFRLTGLTEEIARFQVISLLTACGFTISQSETITYSKRRRRLAFITILFGHIFSLIIVSIAVNAVFQMTASEINTFVGIGIAFSSVFLVIFILIKSKKAKLHFDALINRIYEKLSKKKSNKVIIMDVFKDEIMASIHLTYLPEALNNIPLKYSGIKNDFGIQILILTRQGKRIHTIDGSTLLNADDSIVVFGPEKSIYALFEQKNQPQQ